MILYLFHLIFKILFFFQVLYILTLKIIIDMLSLSPELFFFFIPSAVEFKAFDSFNFCGIMHLQAARFHLKPQAAFTV